MAIRGHGRGANLVFPDPYKMIVIITHAGVGHLRDR
jgi:hypothetical protein